jgi:hypothetical protein
MLAFIIAIFFIAIVIAFGMLVFRAWELRTGRVEITERLPVSNISFRHVEKNMLHLTKYVIQGIIFTGAKYWFITVTKTKKEFKEKLPRINALLKKKPRPTPTRVSFVKRSIIESKIKINRIKERVKKEHGKGEQPEVIEVEKEDNQETV